MATGRSETTTGKSALRNTRLIAPRPASERLTPPALQSFVLSSSRIAPFTDETWPHYKDRVRESLRPALDWLCVNVGVSGDVLVAGNALHVVLSPEQLDIARHCPHVAVIQRDHAGAIGATYDPPAVQPASLRLANQGRLDGRGVRVAVLDSGIDTCHPWLTVSDSISTCDEDVATPGRHGTQMAGVIASRDDEYRGVAPASTLINVKVASAVGVGQPASLVRGIDAALDRDAHVISISVGFNHLPMWAEGGRGWSCEDGECILCTAVNNATSAGRSIVIAAAGNDHDHAEALRRRNQGHTFDSEIACPGTARGAITVGALRRDGTLPASFSSRGVAASGVPKPDISARAENVVSAIPVRRDSDGAPRADVPRARLSGRCGGTSVATALVSGAVALIVQERLESGAVVDAERVRAVLRGQHSIA